MKKEMVTVQRENERLKQAVTKEQMKRSNTKACNTRNLRRIRAAKERRNYRTQHTLRQLVKGNASKTRQIQALKEQIRETDQALCNVEEAMHEARHDGGVTEAENSVLTTTKEGNRYSNEIRELYYNLLALQLPPSKLESTIKTVLCTFAPNVDVTKIQLPKPSLAKNMRSFELSTINAAHQATTLTEASAIHLRTDGTTLNQKKIQGVMANETVLGITNIADGSARSTFSELRDVLSNLKRIATELNLENKEKIGWKMVESIMSDKAATQTALNKLIAAEVEKERKEQADGPGGVSESNKIIIC